MFASAKEAYIRIFGTFEGADEYLPKLVKKFTVLLYYYFNY